MGLSPDESAILSQIPPKLPALTEELITWANQPSGSADTEGLARMSGLLRTSFGEIAGEEPEMVPLPIGSVPALRWRIRPEASTQVFLGGHFDTVYPRDHPFQTCTRLSPDWLRGPGVADMKGGLLVLREALRLFEQSSSATSLGWELLLTPDEETGSLGSAPLLEEAAKRNHFGIVVEPALPSGAVTRERLGSATYHLLANGQAAHVGRCFDQGRNAITTLSKAVVRLHQWNEEPDIICNVGRFQADGPLNVVSVSANASFNVRTSRPEGVDHLLQQLCDDLSEEQDVQLTWSGGWTRPPKGWTPPLEALFHQASRCANDLELPLEWEDTGGCCDGNNLAAAGLPVLDNLGVRGGKIHSAEEFIDLPSLIDRAQLLALLLIRSTSGS